MGWQRILRDDLAGLLLRHRGRRARRKLQRRVRTDETRKQETQKVYKEDDRPIKPMKNNNFMNSENPFGLSKNGFPEDHINSNINYNSQRIAQNQKSKIKRNSKTGNASNKKIKNIHNNNSEFQYIQNEEESKSQSQYQDNQNNINNNNQYND